MSDDFKDLYLALIDSHDRYMIDDRTLMWRSSSGVWRESCYSDVLFGEDDDSHRLGHGRSVG